MQQNQNKKMYSNKGLVHNTIYHIKKTYYPMLVKDFAKCARSNYRRIRDMHLFNNPEVRSAIAYIFYNWICQECARLRMYISNMPLL